MIVVPYVPPKLGGVEEYVANLAAELARQGRYRVLLVATVWRGFDATAAQTRFDGVDGVTIRWLPAQARVSNTPLGIGWGRRLRRIADEESVDLVNAHAPVPFVADAAIRACGRPAVLTYHSGPLRKGRPILDAALRAYERWILRGSVRRSRAIICASPYVRDTLARDVFRPRVVIPPAIDENQFFPASRPTRGSRVLFVGVLDHSARYKGLDYLLDAIRLLVDRGIDVHLEVAGDGDAAADYAARTKQLGLSVHVQFLGAVDRSQIGDVYRRTTVLAVPSTFENFPTVAVEAMACAKPVVATRVGSVGDVVDDGRTGVLVEPGDVVQLADALQWVLANPAAGVKMGAAGRDRVVAELTVRRQAERTAATFDEVLAPSPRRPKKVAVLTPYYSPSIGGVQHYAEKLAAALASSPEFDPVVVTTHRGHRTVVEELGGVMVVRLGTLLTLSNTPVNPAWFWQLRRLMLELGIDVVNAHAPVPGLADVAALTSPRPVVLTYHSGTMQKRDWTDRAVRFYERYVLPRVFDRCASLVAVSPISLCYRTGRSMLISPGVDVEIFVPAASARNCSLLYVGRVERSSRWKGIHVLLAALGQVAKTLPEVVLDVVGTGDAVPEMRAIAAELGVGDRVRWHGALPHRAVVPFYQQAGVLALPSLTNAESFGMVLIEAMATGCPVVGSDVGGIPFVIRDGVDGLLVPPGDAAALAHACLTILQDGRLASRMSEAGRAAAEERWTWSRQTEALMAIFRDVVPRPAIGWHLTATARGQ